MKTLRLIYLLPLMMIVVLMACDHIDEDERLIYVKPVSVGRRVLIEDFTGQRCVNCPNATDEIEKLMAQYGDDNVIAVGIHSGPFAKSVKGVPYSLYTETGDEYFNYWKVESQPKGVIDRKGTSDYTSWATFVRDELSKTASLELSVFSDYSAGQRVANIMVSTMGTDGNTSGHLQVWLIESGITAFQYMPDGSTNREYVHNHVFRKAVNGTWGTDFSIKEGEIKQDEFNCTIDEGWVPENMEVVVFVYNDGGVCQVAKCQLENSN